MSSPVPSSVSVPVPCGTRNVVTDTHWLVALEGQLARVMIGYGGGNPSLHNRSPNTAVDFLPWHVARFHCLATRVQDAGQEEAVC